MNFTTPIPIQRFNNPIDYNSRIVSLGSCFAENMATKLDYFKFENVVNPFGIIFNPISIEAIISRTVNNQLFTESDIFFHNERWHCFGVHSDLSNPDKNQFLDYLNLIIETFQTQLKKASHIIITLGTAWVYSNIKNNQVVANCHKLPQNKFAKELLSEKITEKSIENTIHLIQKINPNCNFIFTVSPVRHIKDGFVENQQSKAHLITALHASIFHFSSCNYFPSYEIMMDELRDYRFYAEDMLHPSQTAIDYIWERFVATAIAEKIHSVMEEVAGIQKSLAHKPFNPNSESHLQFERQLKDKITTLEATYPIIKF